jgi:hypothetical protein
MSTSDESDHTSDVDDQESSDSISSRDPQVQETLTALSTSQLSISELHEVRSLNLSLTMSAHHLQVLKATQLKHQTLSLKYKGLLTKYDALKVKKPAAAKKGSKSAGSSGEKDVTLAGGRFCFAYELWVDDLVFERDRPSGVDPLNHQRYLTPYAQEVAVTAELYESLPPHLQEALMDQRRRPSFKKTVSLLKFVSPLLTNYFIQFVAQVKQERANLVSAARRAASDIFKLHSSYFHTKFDRTTIPKLQALLQNPNKPSEKYPLWAPMIFPERDCNSQTPFAVEELAMVSLRAHSDRTRTNYVLVP